MMIKGTLLLSLPIIKRFFGRKLFKSENAYFWLSFSDPLAKTPGRISVKLTDNSFPARPYVLPYLFGRFYGDSLNKKRKKEKQSKTAFRTDIRRNGRL